MTKTRQTRPGRNGGTLRNGSLPGTNRGGGTGRPPNEFKERMRALASRVAQVGYLEQVLDNPTHPHWPFAVKYVTEHGYGKPQQSVEHSGAVGSYVVEVPPKLAIEEWAAKYRR